MGQPEPQRKNPYSAEGLCPGITLRMEVAVGNQVESYVTKVETVTGTAIGVLPAMERLEVRLLAPGTIVHASYTAARKRFRFITEVTGRNLDGTIQYLLPPATIESSERRSSFRLEAALRPQSLYRLVVDPTRDDVAQDFEGTIVDLSEGGVCVSTREAAVVGERLGFQVELPQAGLLHARVRVAEADAPRPPRRNWRLHCLFLDLSPSNRDRIARYLMRRQLELRRRGQI
ncbi:MAG: PilZ domain-containing protein [Chloroflexi bacterium]|nr:PilZ domain-containing protein [Chloroflexota bacterium]